MCKWVLHALLPSSCRVYQTLIAVRLVTGDDIIREISLDYSITDLRCLYLFMSVVFLTTEFKVSLSSCPMVILVSIFIDNFFCKFKMGYGPFYVKKTASTCTGGDNTKQTTDKQTNTTKLLLNAPGVY